MRTAITVLITCCSFTLPAAAQQFESGDWAATKTDQTCQVFTVRSSKHTSGRLIFRFDNQGFNADFGYEYEPWPGETEAPWGSEDEVVLEIDGEESWLAEEMSPLQNANGYGVFITAGFVQEVISAFGAAQNTVAVLMNRQPQGEKTVYGQFSVSGFSNSMGKASEWCQFTPTDLPSS